METFTNLKRRRNSNKRATKKICAGPPCIDDSLEGPSNAFHPPLNNLPLNRHQHRCQSHSLLLFHFFLHFLHHLPLNTEFHNMLPLNSYKIHNPNNLRNQFNFLNPLNLRNLRPLNLHNPYKWNLQPALIKSNPEEEPIPWRDNRPNIYLRPCLFHPWAHPPLQSCSRSWPRRKMSQQHQFQQHQFWQYQFQLHQFQHQRLQQPKKPDPSYPVNRLKQPNEKGKKGLKKKN